VKHRLAIGVMVAAVCACSDASSLEDDDASSVGGAGGVGGLDGGGDVGGAGGEEPCPFDTMNDPAHCGACDFPCAPGQTCESGQCLCDAAAATPDYETEVRPFFETTCDGSQCHQGPSPILGLNLAFDPYGSIVGVVSFTCGSQMRLLVEPGHPERSHVMNKLMGAGMCGGQQMPPNMPQPEGTLRMIADWICAGAPP
jgi:hypothetical protein